MLDFVLRNVDVTAVDIILKNTGVAKASGIDQISAKFLKDGALVTATFPSKCEIPKIKPLFKK